MTAPAAAADVTPPAHHGAGARRQPHVHEHLADAVMGTVPMTALHLYDAALGGDVLGPVTLLRPDRQPGSEEALAHRSGRRPSLSLHGEVDVTRADDLLRALVDVACDAPGQVVPDLAGLRFPDVAGARAPARATRVLRGADGHLRLVATPRTAARCLALSGLGAGDVVPG